MTKLWADLETFSAVPITYGTHAYAEGAEIMLFAWALDDGLVQVVDEANGEPRPRILTEAIQDPSVTVVAHNSHFDRTVLRHTGTEIELARWYDTMVQALAHGLPGALGALCEILGVDQDKAKDKAGKALIQLFCKPRPVSSKLRRATSKTHPVEWARLVSYAGLDIEAMRAVHAKLPEWNYRGDELDLWRLDQRINDRGFAVDLALAEGAMAAVKREKVVLASRTQEITNYSTVGGLESTTQRDRMLAYLLAEYGVELPDLTKATLERRMNDPDLPIELRDLLAIRLQASTTSASKYKKFVNGVSSDGRLRGTLQFDGAQRTGRWAGRLVQPHNLLRPTLEQSVIDDGIEALKANCADILFDNVMELVSNAVRACIVAAKGKRLVVADLSNIEGRMLAFLAGEEWKLQAFRDFDAGTGPDLYALAYAKAFAVTPEEVMENKHHGDGLMRQIGKVMELMLGYEGGVGAYLTGAATYRIDLAAMAAAARPSIPADVWEEATGFVEWRESRKLGLLGLSPEIFMVCDSLKRLWRRAHPRTVSLWRELAEAATMAIVNPGKAVPCRSLKLRRDGAWLRVRLPSGRFVCYPCPQLDDGKLSYMGVDQYSRKWARIKTYGGKLAENVTQAAARDVLAYGMKQADADGFGIVLTVHDEIITEAPDTEDYDATRLAACMTHAPAWAEGLPLAAAGFEAYHYKKD